MKMLKTIKKLKFWHRKKKKKKQSYLPPPPLHSNYCCGCSCPSAPPLPAWYDTEQAFEVVTAPVSGFAYSTQQQDIVSEAAPSYPTLPVNNTSSYQQYMVPNPVYGIPALPPPPPTKEKSAGIFGCAVEIGRYLFRCFFPCFRVRQVC